MCLGAYQLASLLVRLRPVYVIVNERLAMIRKGVALYQQNWIKGSWPSEQRQKKLSKLTMGTDVVL